MFCCSHAICISTISNDLRTAVTVLLRGDVKEPNSRHVQFKENGQILASPYWRCVVSTFNFYNTAVYSLSLPCRCITFVRIMMMIILYRSRQCEIIEGKEEWRYLTRTTKQSLRMDVTRLIETYFERGLAQIGPLASWSESSVAC